MLGQFIRGHRILSYIVSSLKWYIETSIICEEFTTMNDENINSCSISKNDSFHLFSIASNIFFPKYYVF